MRVPQRRMSGPTEQKGKDTTGFSRYGFSFSCYSFARFCFYFFSLDFISSEIMKSEYKNFVHVRDSSRCPIVSNKEKMKKNLKTIILYVGDLNTNKNLWMTARERKRPRRTNERMSNETRKDEVIDSAGLLVLLRCFFFLSHTHITRQVFKLWFFNFPSSKSPSTSSNASTFRDIWTAKSLLTAQAALAVNVNFSESTTIEEKIPRIPNGTIMMSIDTWYIIAPKWFIFDKNKHRITGKDNKIQFDPHQKLTMSVWTFAKKFH